MKRVLTLQGNNAHDHLLSFYMLSSPDLAVNCSWHNFYLNTSLGTLTASIDKQMSAFQSRRIQQLKQWYFFFHGSGASNIKSPLIICVQK